MTEHRAGCLICGKPLQYSDSAQELKCHSCGQTGQTNAACAAGHYVCDKCHTQNAYDFITNAVLSTESQNPVAIATAVMKSPLLKMHGPEHHYLVAAALLAAGKNSGGAIDLTKSLALALQRSRNVPGGICGFWGCCGAAVGAGIFVSVLTGAAPLSGAEWRLANLGTSQALADVAENGGPRCCKRNTYLALLRSVRFAQEHCGVRMVFADAVVCEFYPQNDTCKKEKCLFYPKG